MLGAGPEKLSGKVLKPHAADHVCPNVECLNIEQTHDRSGQLGKDTVAVENFKQALSTLQQLKEEEAQQRQQLAQSSSSSWKVLGGLFIPMKVTMEMDQVLIEKGDLLYKCLEQFFRA